MLVQGGTACRRRRALQRAKNQHGKSVRFVQTKDDAAAAAPSKRGATPPPGLSSPPGPGEIRDNGQGHRGGFGPTPGSEAAPPVLHPRRPIPAAGEVLDEGPSCEAQVDGRASPQSGMSARRRAPKRAKNQYSKYRKSQRSVLTKDAAAMAASPQYGIDPDSSGVSRLYMEDEESSWHVVVAECPALARTRLCVFESYALEAPPTWSPNQLPRLLRELLMGLLLDQLEVE